MHMRKNDGKSLGLDEDSRYLLKCTYNELIEKPLTKPIYLIIKENKELGALTTTQIRKELKKQDFNVHPATVLAHLNTMAKYELLEKTKRSSNVAFWELGKKRIAMDVLIKTCDIRQLEIYPSNSIFSSGDGVHLYGFPEMQSDNPKKYLCYCNEEVKKNIDTALSNIKNGICRLGRIRCKIMMELLMDKFQNWKKTYPDQWDEVILFSCLAGIWKKLYDDRLAFSYGESGKVTNESIDDKSEKDMHNMEKRSKSKKYIPFDFCFPSWIKEIDGKYMIKTSQDDKKDILDISRGLTEIFFPSLATEKIYNRLQNCGIPKATLDLCTFMMKKLLDPGYISIVVHSESPLMGGALSLIGMGSTYEDHLVSEGFRISGMLGSPPIFVKNPNGMNESKTKEKNLGKMMVLIHMEVVKSLLSRKYY